MSEDRKAEIQMEFKIFPTSLCLPHRKAYLCHSLEIHKHTAWGLQNDSALLKGQSLKVIIRPSSLLAWC